MTDLYTGKRCIRPDSIAKVTGEAIYTSDIFVRQKGILTAKVLRIECACACIKRIDTTKAESIDGVIAVLTSKNIKMKKCYGYNIKDKPIVADDETICDGDPVALVAAETEDIADRAIKSISIEYEQLPFIENPIESLKKTSDIVHNRLALEKKTNVSNCVRVAKGKAEEAFEHANTVIDREFKTPIVEHSALERDVAIAEPDKINGGLTFYCPVQNVHGMREGLSEALELPISKIRVVSPMIGGGFGGKECSSVDCGIVAGILALHTGRPVMYEMTREEIFKYTSKRHRSIIRYKLAADKKGHLKALKADGIFDKGAYKSVDVIPHRAAVLSAGPYFVPAVDVRNRSVFTNHVYGGAFRGLGAPQQHFAIECAMDDMALLLGLDPIEFRLRNIIKSGTTTICNQKMNAKDEEGIRKCILAVKEKINWDLKPDNSNSIIKHGKGIACYMYGTGSSFPKDAGHAYVELNIDGSLNVNVAQNEMGQGLISAMTQIAADSAGVSTNDVNICISDSASAPESGPTSASRATVFQGNAVMKACTALKKRMVNVAAELLGEPVGQLEAKSGWIYVRGNINKRISMREAASRARVTQVPLAEIGDWYPPKTEKDPENLNQTTRFVTFAYGAHAVEVEVNIRTGEITVVKSVHATDVGKAINPSTVEGQMDGATGQAFGWALMEEEFLSGGIIKNSNFHDYLIPTFKDIPELESIIIETEGGAGPFGAKGIGEPTILGGAPAIRNAVLNATGLAFYEIPLTPVRVMEGIIAAKNAPDKDKIPYFRVPLKI